MAVSSPYPPDLPAPQPGKGHTLFSWLFIIGFAVLFLVARNHAERAPEKQVDQEDLRLTVFNIQARYLVGGAQFLPEKKPELLEQAAMLNQGGPEQRLRYAVVAGELGGPAEALKALASIKEADNSDNHARLLDILTRLYEDFAKGSWQAPAVSVEERQLLESKLGWFGELALHPLVREAGAPPGAEAPAGVAIIAALREQNPDAKKRSEVLDDARETFATVLVIVGAGIFIGMAGFLGLIIFLALLKARKLRGGLTTGINYGGIFAETFAIWLGLFIVLNLVMGLLPAPDDPSDHLMRMSLLLAGSMTALAWPVLRGIPWSQVLRDIGWTRGRHPGLEPLAGLACYGMSLPLVAVGAVLMMILMSVQHAVAGGVADLETPIHPIVNVIAKGDTFTRILAAFLACVAAPIVEETMFRGVLYRHLRELTGSWAWLASVVTSGTIVAFIFAALHPQGLVAIPVLMALAYGFTMAREWRGSLIAPMVAHGVNNGLALLMLILLAGA